MGAPGSATRRAVRRAGGLALAGVIANGANVVVTVLIARPLGRTGYGAFSRLIGMFLVLAIPASGLLVVVVRRITAWHATRSDAELEQWVRGVRRTGYVVVAVVAVVAAVSRGWVADRLRLPGPAGVAEVIVAGTGWALLAVDRGLIQARRAYGSLARNLCVEAGARTIVTLGLVAAGVGVEGAALGLVAALVAADLDARRSLRRLVAQPPPPVDDAEPSPAAAAAPVAPVMPVAGRRQLAADVMAALGALGLLALLQNVDVIVLGRQAPHNAGAYAPVSVSSKALVFAALVLSGYLLPEAATRSHRGEHALRQLGVALGLLAVPAAGLLTLAVGAPRLVLRLVFGARLAGAAPAFAWLVLAMAALGASVLLTHYLLGVGRRLVVALLVIAVVPTTLLVAAADGDPTRTARADFVCQLALALAAAALVWRSRPAPDPDVA